MVIIGKITSGEQQMPKVSVIVPCYNVEAYLEKGLDSLTKQTLTDLEIICIDDCSTDNTLEILHRYAKTDSRIKVIEHKKNTGVSIARNDGMKQATGDYIGFIDPDDYIDLDFYEKLYKAAIETSVDIVKGNVKTIYSDGRVKSSSKAIKKIEHHPYNFSTFFGSAIYNKDFLERNKINFPTDVITGQDSVFLSHVVLSNPKIAVIYDIYYNYFYQRPGSLDSNTLSHKKVLSRIKMLDYKMALLSDFKVKDDASKSLFLIEHVLGNFAYTFDKKFEEAGDKEALFNWLTQSGIPESVLKKYFGLQRAKAVVNQDYKNFAKYTKNYILYRKEYMPNGERNIYIFGKKVFSYKRG